MDFRLVCKSNVSYAWIFIGLFFLQTSAQSISVASENGRYLPTRGHLPVLVIFAEYIYPPDQPQKPDHPEWQAGQLPKWHHLLFEKKINTNPQALVSRYYQEASFGLFQVTGDRLLNPAGRDLPIQVPAGSTLPKVLQEYKVFETEGGSKNPADFDIWDLDVVQPGSPKRLKTPNSPQRFDHVMVIWRNHPNQTFYAPNSGTASAGNFFNLMGFGTDTYSQFGANRMTLKVLLHEINHLLLGENNFHAGGGHHHRDNQLTYFPAFVQGGWGMVGGASSSLMTPNAWDRRRLNWKLEYKKMIISGLDSIGKNEIAADIIADSGSYIFRLRDFVKTGDAIRIKLPTEKGTFPQWLWLENHLTQTYNQSPFDVFQYQQDFSCTNRATSGIYAYVQIDKEQLTGEAAWSGYADYLRVLPANGCWDYVYDTVAIWNPCVSASPTFPFQRNLPNPFSGYHDQELAPYDANNDNLITVQEYHLPYSERLPDTILNVLTFHGRAEHAFIPGDRIALDTNPAAVNCLTLTDKNQTQHFSQDNRSIILSGLEILIDRRFSDGSILVKINDNQQVIRKSVRWCAPQIILPSGSLTIAEKATVTLAQSNSPNIWKKDSLNTYSPPTKFIVRPKATITLLPKSTWHIAENSQVQLEAEATIILEKNSRIVIDKRAKLLCTKEQIVSKGGKIIYR